MSSATSEIVHGFELIRDQQISEINTRARLYRHLKTGAELLSLENADENKCFGVSFKTPPPDDTGLPHILEHSVLCGSQKYPVKEPFIELVKGSLATFINAMTFPDKTIYPVASQNVKDFYNLIDVYLDAVFHPNITPDTLQQEGWHYELESLDAPLTYKGVVFNEMKGIYSSPDDIIDNLTQQALYPDTAYARNYGGDPRHIPELTYEDLRAFHQTYYHPSNSQFYFYGDDDPIERLRKVNEVLQPFDKIEIAPEIGLQPSFDAPRRKVEKYDAGETDDHKGMVTVSWLLPENSDPERTMALEILSSVLMGTPAAPLKKALIESGLGEDTIGGGIDNLRQLSFTVGMKGIDPANVDQVETLILDTLRHLTTEGIDPATVEAAINTAEFQMREYNTGGFPRGLAMMIGALSTWTYSGDPLAPLAFEAPFQAIKARVANGEKLFESLIQAHLLDNPHRSMVILEPDPTVNAQLKAEERAKLDTVRARLTDAELQQIVDDTRRLQALQEQPNSPEALATLPMLTLADLDKETRIVPNEVLSSNGAPVLFHDLFTNGVFYLDLAFDLQAVPQALLPYIPLFSRALLEMGTTKESFVQLTQRIGIKTGGIAPAMFLSETASGDGTSARFVVRGKATMPHVGDLFDILHDVLTITQFNDKERFRQIALKLKAGRESSLIPGGHSVVARRLNSSFSLSGWLSEQISGVENLFFLRDLLPRIDSDWDSIVAKLEAIRTHLLNRSTLLANITLDAANWASIQAQFDGFVAGLPQGSGQVATWTPTYSTYHEGLTIPTQVNYVGKAANLYSLGYKLNGMGMIISKWLSTDWLWERVRMMGGAYGGFAEFDPYTGVFSYGSYRDPNLLETLANYDSSADYLQHLDLSEAEVTKAIIGAIADIDDYQLPDAKGYSQMARYLVGLSDARRQEIRQMVLATTAQDFRDFGAVLAQMNPVGRVVVLGSQEAIDGANAVYPNMLQVTKVL